MARLPFVVLPALVGPIATGNERANRPAINMARLDYPGMTWKSDGNANIWLRGNFDAATDIDFVAIFAANALAGTTIRVRLGSTQAEVDGTAPYDSTALPFISPDRSREDGLYHSHLETGASVSCTWWRIDIGGHTGDFEAAGLVMGKTITPARFYDRDFERGIEDLGSLDISRTGVVSEVPGYVLRTLLFRLSWVDQVEFETKFAPLIEFVGQRGIVLWCFDPEAGPYRQSKTYLGWFGRAPFARGGAKPRTFTMDFQIRSIL